MKKHLFLILFGLAPALRAADWPQLQNNPQRHGYSSENIDAPIANTWRRGFAPERIHPQTQPVVAGNRLYIGTEMGTLYALDAVNGNTLWSFKAGGPILHTAGVENGRVFFGSLDGNVYALDAASGAQLWKFPSVGKAGFSTAVLLVNGRVYIADREGNYYALAQTNGLLAWQRDLGAPILMSSCYDNGKIFVGANDMHVYALDAGTGAQLWKSAQIWGSYFKDYWPVAFGGKVLIRPRRVQARTYSPPIPWATGPLAQAEVDKQANMILVHAVAPKEKDFIALDQDTGQETTLVPQWSVPAMNPAAPPPVVDGDGRLIVPIQIQDWRAGWGRLDLAAARVTETLYDGTMNGPNPKGTGNTDETLLVSAAGRLVFTLHTQEFNAHYTGFWHLDRRRWTGLSAFHAQRFFLYNTQGAGGSPAAISNGRVFHNTLSNVNGRTATVLP